MPSMELMAVLGFIVMFIGLALGIHLGVVLGVTGFLGCVLLLGFSKSLSMLTTTPFFTVSNFNLIVLPMFILMGELAFQGGLGKLLYEAASKWLGRLHGGLAMASVAANALFGAISGSSLAAVATFGKIAVPEMLAFGYDKKLAAGVVVVAGTLAVMIPPSGAMVLYCIFTEASLGKLMMAGIVPGVITAILYLALIYFRVLINPHLAPSSSIRISWKERFAVLRWLTPIAIIMVVMLGGIYTGIFSPIEAGAIGAFTVFIIFLARRGSLIKLKDSFANTARSSAMIFWVIIGAMLFSKFLALSQLPDAMFAFVSNLSVPPIGVLITIMLIYIILGCIMDVTAMLVVTLPIFFPLLSGLGFDEIWVGILVIKIVEIAAITPPIGLNLFILEGVLQKKVNLEGIIRGSFPFLIIEFLTLTLFIAVPKISLWLPSMMFQ